MKITGFSFIRNAIKYDYPIEESLRSLLPVTDEIIVAVGKSDDKTLELIQKIDKKKIRILQTVWDDAKREGGRVLAEETQKAYDAIADNPSGEGKINTPDWAFYLQGDEVLHEADYPVIRAATEKYRDDERVDGLLFKYKHFYGSYDYLGASRRWYRREIRIVRPPRFALRPQHIYSYKDAQGFRKDDGRKLRVKEIDAYIYHYGWVKPPAAQMQKQQTFNKYWHDDEWMKKNIPSAAEFDYSNIDSLVRFTGTHPAVMKERIRSKNWHFDFDISRSRYTLKEKISGFIERITGYRPGEYKNYIKI
ncbi:MAG: glycosyltransferase family 2 protein [Spirochaetes bacterium]|nr:glycosyltransferase family 2 protein [Spirochaetota bacterium]